MKWRSIVMMMSVFLLSLSMTACVIVSTSATPNASTGGSANGNLSGDGSGEAASGERYCILAPDGAGFQSRGGTFNISNSGATTETLSAGENAGEGSAGILHGELVWSTLQDELRKRGAEKVTSDEALAGVGDLVVVLAPDEFSFLDAPAVERQQLWKAPGVGDVLLVALDIRDFKVDEATSLISSTVDSYQRVSTLTMTDGVAITLPGASKFVVNMSWIEVPCGKLPVDKKGYLALLCDTVNSDGDKALSDLMAFKMMTNGMVAATFKNFCDATKVEERVNVPDPAFDAFAANPTVGRLILQSTYETNTLGTVINNDRSQSLYETLNCSSQNGTQNPDCPTSATNIASTPGVTVINIAAAGNSGLHYAFAPALFNGVISVSSSDAVTSFETISSTVVISESADPIAHPMYSNWGEVAMPGMHPDGVHMGSSFAAPRLSVWAALYLLHGGKSPCDGHSDVPVLGYKGGTNNAAPMRNMELDAAIREYCDSSPFP